MSPDIDEQRILRAVDWCMGRIDIGGIQVRLQGEDVPTRMHTLLAGYPHEEEAVLIDLSNGKRTMELKEVCRLLRGYTLPAEKVKLQRDVWAEDMSRIPPNEFMMERALAYTQLLGLPVGLCMFGDAVESGALLAMLQVPLGAPLEVVLNFFKTTVPMLRR